MATPTDVLIRKTYDDELARASTHTLDAYYVAKDRVAKRLNLTKARVHEGVARTVRSGA